MNNKRLKTAFKLAFNSLRLNLLRTSLTVLGVVIGVAAIIIVFSAGDMLNNLVYGELESHGTNTIQVEPKAPGKEVSVSGELVSLKMDDLEAINKLENISNGYGVSLTQLRASYGAESKKILVFGTSPSYTNVDSKTKLASGNYFDEADNKSQASVAVLGAGIKEHLFGDREALGQMVSLGSRKFKVIGVLEEQGSIQSFIDFNEMVYIPIDTLHKRIMGIDYALYFKHQLKDVDYAMETAEEIKELLRERHDITDINKDDFRISTMEEMMEILGTVTGAVTALLLAIVLISLLVGGVGIMNIMYVSVSERTPEIGLRKALGANKRDIVYQFLIEAMMITFWGWILGVVIGTSASYLLTILAKYLNIGWQFYFPWEGIGFSLLFSIICGLLFGYRPARQAAGLDPVEALRKE